MAERRLLDQIRESVRLRHYGSRTEQQYVGWLRRFILFHGKRHPREMGAKEVESFLTSLAVQRGVAAATQNQALAALLFLYRHVLKHDLPWLNEVVRARKPRRLPMVLTRQETGSVLAHLSGAYWLIGNLLYGSGLRLLECLRLRVHDIDFDRAQVFVRNGKGDKDRVTVLPGILVAPLRAHLESVLERHRVAIQERYAGVELPYSVAHKYPGARTPCSVRCVLPCGVPGSRSP